MNYNTRINRTASKPVEFTPVKLYHVTLHDRQIFNLSAMRNGVKYIGGSVEYLGHFVWAILTRKTASEVESQLSILGVSNFTIVEVK